MWNISLVIFNLFKSFSLSHIFLDQKLFLKYVYFSAPCLKTSMNIYVFVFIVQNITYILLVSFSTAANNFPAHSLCWKKSYAQHCVIKNVQALESAVKFKSLLYCFLLYDFGQIITPPCLYKPWNNVTV